VILWKGDFMKNYIWEYGENEYQKYYECTIGKDRIVVFANKYEGHNDKMYMCTINKDGRVWTIMNKNYNDRQRKKNNETEIFKLRSIKVLASENIEYMKSKAIRCYEQDKIEISA
jgi:hypothetical protein